MEGTWESYALAIMATALLTGTGAWVTIGRKAVSRGEVEQIVATTRAEVERNVEQRIEHERELNDRTSQALEQLASEFRSLREAFERREREHIAAITEVRTLVTELRAERR